MSIANELPIRYNGKKITASWFNTIRAFLIGIFGGAVTSVHTQDISDNQSVYQDVVDLSFDKDIYSAVTVEYTIVRKSDAETRREHGFLYLTYEPVEGCKLDRESHRADALNMPDSFRIPADGGEVQYKSDEMGETHVGKISWRIISSFNLEGI